MSQGILWATVHPNFQAYVALPPRYPNQPAEPHITLRYGVDRQDWQLWEGKEFWAQVLEECWSDRIQALRVKLPPEIPCQNKHPHITLSWVDGAEPVESNEMLDEAHQKQALQYSVLCRIEFYEWTEEEGGEAENA